MTAGRSRCADRPARHPVTCIRAARRPGAVPGRGPLVRIWNKKKSQ
ncbi:hypothetical protein Salmuc_05272 [Salipiger mucosus DSM 16094]|uniref:Uncharacterized protein n=1 Tax=Salipiger mucosus DSM 16094 TaxID=1123237 RepID=S9Q9R0_9RHOB|nr:hypothetical protein Salmuc_05272 [Salipiger mucosus DSM 16094]